MHTGDVSSPVKITKPRVTGIVHRKRLFRALDSARRPILWITGPAGSGKTSLIGSYVDARKLPCLWYQIDSRDGDVATFFYYLGLAVKKAAPHYRKPLPLLTPEYLLDLTTFTKRYFEELFKRLKQPGVLVFDNYQDVPLDSVFHDVIRDALSTVPENIRVIAISRSDPAPKLARLRVEREMVSMGWKDVRFTLEESKMLVASCRKEVPLKAPIEQLYRQTDGWAAGLVLMSRAPLVASARTDLPAWQTPSELFDYFAGELFDKTDAGTRDFLLCTSFLPTFTASMAQLLSGSEQAARLLAHLQRNNFFITSSADSVYQYHPLFREFLSVRAREIFSKEYLAKIQQSAASILKDNGRPEDAAELFREAEDWQLFIELTMEQAPSLVAKGRLQTLSTWLTAIPEQQFADSPWLWYWLGTCRVPFDPKEGLRHFENAFELFQTQGDMRGALLAWSGAVNAVLLGWDDFSPLNSLINWFYERADSITFPSTEMEAECASSMAGAMVWRQPDHPDIGEWVERALNLTRKSENFALKLQAHIHASNYYLWVGDISNALLVDKEMQEMTRGPAVSPLMLIACKWLEAGTSYLAADSYESGLRAISAAAETAQAYGIHVWDNMVYGLGVYGALLKGDRKTASEFLNKMKATLRADRSHGYCHYHYLVAWYNVLFGDSSKALSHAELSLKLALEIRGIGFYFPEILCRLALTNILCEKKDFQRAAHELALADDVVRRSKSRIMDFMYRLTKARTALAQGDEAGGMAMLRSALELGRSQNFINMLYWWQPTVMAVLCQRALEDGIEVDYVQNLVRKRNLFSESPPPDLDNWPWPLKISTLGRFTMTKDGQPLIFSGKVQQKPLFMLKAVIAFGGREVSEDQLMDALWPDAEGDVGRISFRTTLHRLRQLTGNEKAIQLQEGRITLDLRYCWVDAWAFERIAGRAEAFWKKARDNGNRADDQMARDIVRLSEKAMTLYEGEFLPGDRRQPWTFPMRERLKSRFISLAGKIGDYYTNSEQWERGLECYLNALEVDELQEEFYRRLMISYHKLEKCAEALSVYDRCRGILSSVLGIEPSPETEALRRKIRSTRQLCG